MNSKTRDDLIDFIATVEDLAWAVSSVAGTYAVKVLIERAEELKKQLRSDETIL